FQPGLREPSVPPAVFSVPRMLHIPPPPAPPGRHRQLQSHKRWFALGYADRFAPPAHPPEDSRAPPRLAEPLKAASPTYGRRSELVASLPDPEQPSRRQSSGTVPGCVRENPSADGWPATSASLAHAIRYTEACTQPASRRADRRAPGTAFPREGPTASAGNSELSPY